MIWFGRHRFHQRADIDENAPRVGDEGVEGLVAISTTWIFCLPRLAARRIGLVYSRSNCSISASRMIGRPAFFGKACACAAAGDERDRRRRSARPARARLACNRVLLDKWRRTRPCRRELVDSAQPIEAAAAGQITPKSLSFGMRKRRQKPFECGKTGASRPRRAETTTEHAGYSQKTDDAVVAQRCSALHGDGRDVGGRENRSRGRACDSHGGRAAVRLRAEDRDRGRAGGAQQPHRLYRGARHSVAAGAHRATL